MWQLGLHHSPHRLTHYCARTLSYPCQWSASMLVVRSCCYSSWRLLPRRRSHRCLMMCQSCCYSRRKWRRSWSSTSLNWKRLPSSSPHPPAAFSPPLGCSHRCPTPCSSFWTSSRTCGDILVACPTSRSRLFGSFQLLSHISEGSPS